LVEAAPVAESPAVTMFAMVVLVLTAEEAAVAASTEATLRAVLAEQLQ
jgi:hypothetical protein